jgi:mRNA-degrading endonuclease toxin of MazEF toxin-antitoxin module
MEKSPALRKNELEESNTPGIGVAGIVMCPLTKGACLKQGCEFWVELNYGEQKVARCSHAWDAILKVELRQSVDRLHHRS